MTPPTQGQPRGGSPSRPRRYRKTAYVIAEQATEAGAISTPEGVMQYEAGDYIVSDAPPTHVWPVKREVFERTHALIEWPNYETARREFDEYADVIERANR